MKIRLKKMLHVLLLIAIILSGITLYLYNKTYGNVIHKEKKEQEMSYYNHSITKIINRTIVVDEDSVRKDIIFFFKSNDSIEDRNYVYNCLRENFSNNSNGNISVAKDKEDGEHIIRLVFFNENLKTVNKLLKENLGKQNNIQYGYDAKSIYEGKSKFHEKTDIAKIVDFFEYTGDIRYEVHGYKDENIGELQINNKKVDVDGYVYKGDGEEKMELSYQGKYANYWPLARKVEHLVGIILVAVGLVVVFKKKSELYSSIK